ncbi:MAG: CCXG family PEP-CTERM protein [Pseudomonadales bacterium]
MNTKLKLLTGAAALALSASAQAGLLTFDYSVTSSNYQINGSESAQDLVDAHNAGSVLCTDSADGFVRMGPRQNCGFNTRGYSLNLTTEFDLSTAGEYTFQAGADWGRGGGVVLTDLDNGNTSLHSLRTDDVWWSRNWNNRDVFNTTFDLGPGSYAVSWIGFEYCCGGETSIRYSYNGSEFSNFTAESFGTHLAEVPEPGIITMLGAGLAGVALIRRRRPRLAARAKAAQ